MSKRFIESLLHPFGVLSPRREARVPLYSAGDTVRVRSREAISELIGPTGKLEGCLFMDQMWDYCGMTFSVSRVVRSYYSERRGQTFVPLSPLYILANLTCDGRAGHFGTSCDHGCFILWHEDWLDGV